MSKYLNLSGLSHFKDKCDDTYVSADSIHKMYEHRIAYNCYYETSSSTYQYRLEFSFVNDVADPYLASSMSSSSEIISALQTLFNDLEDITYNADYANSNITDRAIPCRGFYSNNGVCQALYLALVPSEFTANSTYTNIILYMNYVTTDSINSLSTVTILCDGTVSVEDNVRIIGSYVD